MVLVIENCPKADKDGHRKTKYIIEHIVKNGYATVKEGETFQTASLGSLVYNGNKKAISGQMDTETNTLYLELVKI